MANAYWLSEVTTTVQITINEDVRKNVGIILQKKKGRSYFTLLIKGLLNKPPQWRTKEEKELLAKVISTVKFIRKYSQNVQKELSSVTTFAYFGPGRILVREHRPPGALYYLITGRVIGEHREENVTLNETETKSFIFQPGDVLCEPALLTGMPQTLTLRTDGHCEFLLIHRDDYMSILIKYSLLEFPEVEEMMRRYDFFNHMQEYAMKDVSLAGRIKTFTPGTLILSDEYGKYNTFFVLDGTCQVMEYLLVYRVWCNLYRYKFKFYSYEEEMKYRQRRQSLPSEWSDPELSLKVALLEKSTMSLYRLRDSTQPKVNISGFDSHTSLEEVLTHKSLLPKLKSDVFKKFNFARSNMRNDLPFHIETYPIEVCTYGRDAVFGVGENMHRRHVFAKSTTRLLILPKHILIKHQMDTFKGLRVSLDKMIPNSEQVFQHFVRKREFATYKRELLNSLRQHPSGNKFRNVPLSIRIRHDLSLTY